MSKRHLLLSALLGAAPIAISFAQNTGGAPSAAQAPTGEQNAPDGESAAGERIITITYSGGNLNSPNLRYGPYTYTHPQPGGIVAEVSNLKIFTQQGELRAPEGVLIAEAEGRREASFTGGVRVERGRLTATGPALNYSEATGRGVMPQATEIVVEPAEEGEEDVNIRTDEVTFDVDTDTSVSRGDVMLESGNQEAQAQELIFEEGRDLAVLSSGGQQVTARRENDDGTFLTITADEISVLTNEDTLLATGNVTIVDGDITTTGDVAFYDDEASRAEVIGEPAVSENRALGTRTTGGRIEQRTDIDAVRVLSDPQPSFDQQGFALTDETPTQ